jgi:hypothetical protein
MVQPIFLTGLIIIVGNYGSGKTEVAINLAIDQKNEKRRVRIADLDLVNPYFRTREARRLLEARGIEVLLPPEKLLQADLPILIPQVAGLVRAPGDLSILDVGGSDSGASVLAVLKQAFHNGTGPVTTIQVVNPFRPNTETVNSCQDMRRMIEVCAGMPVNRWVGNAHMLEETTLENFNFGCQFMANLQSASGLAVEFVTIPHYLASFIKPKTMNWPVLPIHQQLVPPWKKAVKFAARSDCKE